MECAREGGLGRKSLARMSVRRRHRRSAFSVHTQERRMITFGQPQQSLKLSHRVCREDACNHPPRPCCMYAAAVLRQDEILAHERKGLSPCDYTLWPRFAAKFGNFWILWQFSSTFQPSSLYSFTSESQPHIIFVYCLSMAIRQTEEPVLSGTNHLGKAPRPSWQTWRTRTSFWWAYFR